MRTAEGREDGFRPLHRPGSHSSVEAMPRLASELDFREGYPERPLSMNSSSSDELDSVSFLALSVAADAEHGAFPLLLEDGERSSEDRIVQLIELCELRRISEEASLERGTRANRSCARDLRLPSARIAS